MTEPQYPAAEDLDETAAAAAAEEEADDATGDDAP